MLQVVTSVLLASVSGDYELKVTFHRFYNLNQRCAECHNSNGTTNLSGCCDDITFEGSLCNRSQCDVFFSFCQGRSLHFPEENRTCLERKNTTIVRTNINGIPDFNNTVLGEPNPVILTGKQWVSWHAV